MHCVFVNLDASKKLIRVLHRRVCQGAYLREHDPFDFPPTSNISDIDLQYLRVDLRSGTSLMVFNHGVKQTRAQLPHRTRHGSNIRARDGIPLLGHRAARAAVGLERFAHLADFCLHHQLHVKGKFRACCRQQREERPRFGDSVPFRMPSDVWDGKTELCSQSLLAPDSKSWSTGRWIRVWKGSKSSGCPAKFDDKEAGADFSEAGAVASEGGEEAGHFEAKGDGDGLLQIGTRCHGSRSVPLAEATEGGDYRVEAFGNEDEGVSELKDCCRVGNVLCVGEWSGIYPENFAPQRTLFVCGISIMLSRMDWLDIPE